MTTGFIRQFVVKEQAFTQVTWQMSVYSKGTCCPRHALSQARAVPGHIAEEFRLRKLQTPVWDCLTVLSVWQVTVYSHPSDFTHSLIESLQQPGEAGEDISVLIFQMSKHGPYAQKVALNEYLLNEYTNLPHSDARVCG